MGLKNIIKNFHTADIAWQYRRLRFTPFHPVFWSHIKIYDAILSVAYKANGVMLDAGCGIKPYEELFDGFVESYLGLEYSTNSGYIGHKADIIGNIMDLNIESESIDTILCTEVLEHIENPIAAINEFFRVLRPGGIVILTVPFAFPVHDEKDYWRFSEQGLRLLFDNSGFIVEEIKPITNTAMSIAILFNMYIFDIGFVWKKWLYPFGLLLRPILWIIIAIINLSFGLAGLIITSEHLPSNIMLIAKKD